MKGKKRISLLAVLVCMFALVFSLALMSACGDGSGNVTKETADGATWYYGASAPAATLGDEGDYYLDTETLASYVKTGTNWRAAEKDETGTWFYGENAPLDTVGIEGDFYLNLKTGALYHKSSAGWGDSILTFKGEQGEKGRDGVLWFSGDKDPKATDPLLKDAFKGDFYLNTTDFTVWQLDSTNTWTKLGSIKPDDGAAGKDGVNGKSAYELYVEEYKKDHEDDNYMSQEDWLASLKGDKGETGERGEKGDEGDKGATGDKGDKGEPGTNGTDGKSAYELYVEQYKAEHEGSEDGLLNEKEWLESLKGKDGTNGTNGQDGQDGVPGKDGQDGQDGEDGKSAYELYVEQFKADESNAGKEPLSLEAWLASYNGTDGLSAFEIYKKYHPEFEGDEQAWLASLKGDKGDPGEDSVHFYNGDGEPSKEITEKAVEGDLYVGQFDGTDGKGSGSILYRYINGKWVPIMESMTQPGTISIYSLEKLIEFSKLVAAGKIADGVEVHLKTDIDFNEAEGVSLKARAAARTIVWTPIGTEAHPFNGKFYGEDHTISNFTIEVAADNVAGFFGKVNGATIQDLHFKNVSVTATGEGAYGAVVAGQTSGTVTITNVTVSGGTVEAKDENAKVGGLVGKVESGTVTAKDVEVTASGVEAGEGGKQAFVGEGDITMENDYMVGEEVKPGFAKKTVYSTAGEPTGTVYEISSLDGLKTFRDSVNGTGVEVNNYFDTTVTLSTDIDLDNQEWTPIGNSFDNPFVGYFDGQGHTIFNLKISDSSSNSYLGFFGVIGSDTIDDKAKKNTLLESLTIENVSIQGNSSNSENLGAFAGYAYGTDLKNLTLRGNVSIEGRNSIGGIVGKYNIAKYASGATQGNKYRSSDIKAIIDNIKVDTIGKIKSYNYRVGAIVGYMYKQYGYGTNQSRTCEITNIIVKNVSVEGTSSVGGLFGYVEMKKVTMTVDGVQMSDVKLFSCDTTSSGVQTFGAIFGQQVKGESIQRYTFKNLSGTVSVAMSEANKKGVQAERVDDGTFGTNQNGDGNTTITIETNTLAITWYGEPVVAE